MNIHELKDELSNQKLLKQLLLFRGKIDLDGNFVEISMPFESIEAFEKFLESIDEHNVTMNDL